MVCEACAFTFLYIPLIYFLKLEVEVASPLMYVYSDQH